MYGLIPSPINDTAVRIHGPCTASFQVLQTTQQWEYMVHVRPHSKSYKRHSSENTWSMYGLIPKSYKRHSSENTWSMYGLIPSPTTTQQWEYMVHVRPHSQSYKRHSSENTWSMYGLIPSPINDTAVRIHGPSMYGLIPSPITTQQWEYMVHVQPHSKSYNDTAVRIHGPCTASFQVL